MSTLVIHHLPAELEAALRAEAGDERSLEEAAMDLLRSALGLKKAPARSNGLRQLAGRWSEEEQLRFEEAVAPFDKIDAELWR